MTKASSPHARSTPLCALLAFTSSGAQSGIATLPIQHLHLYEEPVRIANAPAFIHNVVTLRGLGMVVDTGRDVLIQKAAEARLKSEFHSAIASDEIRMRRSEMQ